MYEQQKGDIILLEEGHWRDKLSRVVMSSETVWHYLLKKIDVPYYHTSIAYADKLIIEQKRWGLQMVNWNPNKKQIIFRPKNYCGEFRIVEEKYDFLNCFGHLMAWLTGIKYFKRLHLKGRQTCVLMGMLFCQDNCGEKFPVKKLWEWHTQDLYRYLLKSSDYEMVYKNE